MHHIMLNKVKHDPLEIYEDHMSSINIRFNDEYPKQGHCRSQLINTIKDILDKDPDLFGTSLTLSFSKKSKIHRYEYRSGRFQTPKVNELVDCLIQSDKEFYNGGVIELT